MTDDDRRLKYYGPGDYGTYYQIEQAAELLAGFDPSAAVGTVSDVIELHNAQLFAANNLLPADLTESQRTRVQEVLPRLRATVGKYFNSLNDTNLASGITDVGYEYHEDLLQLFAKYKVYERCAAATMLPVLDGLHLGLGEMLANQSLVRAYDEELRERLLARPVNAEHLIRKHLEKAGRRDVHLPPSLTPEDERALINAYLDSEQANPNFVELVTTARLKAGGAIDAKTKLKAQRKHREWTEDFFKENAGIKTGCEVSLSDEQTEPVVASSDGMLSKFTYSRLWLEDTLDSPSILNNFLYVFEFTERSMLLTLPSFQAQLGIVDRFMRTTGKESYPAGAAFQFKESCSWLQTAFYSQFLISKDVELEAVIAWFFSDYLRDEFNAANFRYVPSSKASSYLEKCRHIFAEMESVAKQFALYVENGELDTGLLAVASEQVRYPDLPSLMVGKYIYPATGQDVQTILHLLFSDQSHLTYINEDLKADDAARLFIDNTVAYNDFADYQKRHVDFLIDKGVLRDEGERVWFANTKQFLVLRDVFNNEAASYYHYRPETRAVIDQMVTKGWLVRRESLLTAPEASYFDYCLNQHEFSNGPDLRNKYLHGAHVDASDEDEHFRTYIAALKLMVALVIKINDDFCLRDDKGQA